MDKELRFAGQLIKLIFRPSEGRFKFANRLTRLAVGRDLKGLACEELGIPRQAENSNIRVRIYRPNKTPTKPLPALLYLHGGGYVLGVPEIAHRQIKAFIDTRDCVVIAPDYRKSGEAPYPAALNDAYDTLIWIKNNAEKLGVATDQIMVGGHSAGGGLTAATCLYARDKQEVNIAFQMPIYPMIDDRMSNPSAVNNRAPLWDSKSNEIAWGLYLRSLNEKGEEIPPYAAPARNTNYENLPPMATFVGDLEPFKDETIEHVENLKKAGVETHFELYEGCYHGFESVVPKAKVSRDAIGFLLNAFAYAVDNYKAPQAS